MDLNLYKLIMIQLGMLWKIIIKISINGN